MDTAYFSLESGMCLTFRSGIGGGLLNFFVGAGGCLKFGARIWWRCVRPFLEEWINIYNQKYNFRAKCYAVPEDFTNVENQDVGGPWEAARLPSEQS